MCLTGLFRGLNGVIDLQSITQGMGGGRFSTHYGLVTRRIFVSDKLLRLFQNWWFTKSCLLNLFSPFVMIQYMSSINTRRLHAVVLLFIDFSISACMLLSVKASCLFYPTYSPFAWHFCNKRWGMLEKHAFLQATSRHYFTKMGRERGRKKRRNSRRKDREKVGWGRKRNELRHSEQKVSPYSILINCFGISPSRTH